MGLAFPDIPLNEKKWKGALLDLDNTFYEYSPCHSSAQKSTISFLGTQLPEHSQTKIEESLKLARERVHRDLEGTGASHHRLLYFHKALEDLTSGSKPGLAIDSYNTYWGTFLSEMQINEKALTSLKLFKSSGLKTAIVTDLVTEIQFRKIAKLQIGHLIDFIVTSEEAGKEKPHPDIFKLALEKIKLEPHEVFMVGDHPIKDIAGAKKLGIEAFQVLEES